MLAIHSALHSRCLANVPVIIDTLQKTRAHFLVTQCFASTVVFRKNRLKRCLERIRN